MDRVKWAEITAVFGGAFDPPHLGHREAVECVLRNPGVRNVIVIPSGNPPLKTTATPAEHRLEMTKLNFARLREGLSMRVEIDDRETKRTSSEPTYTYDTVQELKRDLARPLAFIVGVDQIESLDRWHRIRELLGQCHWIAIEREGDSENAANRMSKGLKRLQALGLIRSTGNPREWEGPEGKTILSVPTDARATSSTEIRLRFARGTAGNPEIDPLFIGQIGSESLPAPSAENLHPDVESYLMAHHLYGT